MFCPHCGKQVNDGDVFCNSCGKEINNSGTPGTATQTGKKSSKIAVILIATVAVFAVALGIFHIIKGSNKIIIETPKKVTEISGLYKGLAGYSSEYIFFNNSPDNNDLGLYLELSNLSLEPEEDNSFVLSGTWKFKDGEVTTYSDSILEMQSMITSLGGEPTDYDGTVYTLYGDYLFAEEDIYNGNIPDLKKFDAVCTDGHTTYTFNKNGTYTRENEKISESGKYSRSESIITLTPNDSEKVKELFVYNGGVTNFAWVKCISYDEELNSINSFTEKESKTVEKEKANLIKEVTSILKFGFDVKDIDVICDISFRAKDEVMYTGYASFELKTNNTSELVRIPIKLTINLSNSDGEVKYYYDDATIGGLTMNEIKALTNP